MQLKEFGVSLGDLIHEFNFEVVYGPEGFEKTEITKDDVNRPGLQLAGFFDYFDPNRIQIMGKVESSYVEGLSSEERRSRFDRLFETGIPVLLLSRNIDVFPECLAAAQEHGVPILRTNEFTSTIMSAIIAFLKVNLAPRVTLHGVLIEIYGEGVLLLGDSGVGKSETAIELVKRGHRLIADDAVEIKRVSDKTLVGTAPEVIRHFIELRGIGIINVARVFGIGSVRSSVEVEMAFSSSPGTAPRTMTARAWRRSITTSSVSRCPACSFPLCRAVTWPSFWKRLPSTTARRRWATTPPRNC